MSEMLIYVESEIKKSISITLHFDNNTVKTEEIGIGDEIALLYLLDKKFINLQGKVIDIFVNKFNKAIVKLDLSERFGSNIIYIVTENIRDFLEVVPAPVIGDGNIDTIEEIVSQLRWIE